MNNRRFIAGAICPACGAVDKLVVLLDSSDQRRECISCAYSDSLEDTATPAEPATRVNQARPGEPALPHEIGIQVLHLTDKKDNDSPE